MTTAQPRPSATAGTAADTARELTLELPMVTIRIRPPELRLPRVPLPDMPRLPVPRLSHVTMPHVNRQEVGHAVDVARSLLPPPERVAYYGALGALAVVGVIEWPVAAAIGAGTVIAQRARSKEPASGADPGDAGNAVRAPAAKRAAGAKATRGKKAAKART
ncbi:hypothetical protein ACWGH8_41285 [Nonomuraea muscovyensis]|uniref:Uncharacterized protein n=1 Tax=Nonomuraea muscovyensis TaxID=1124761 RepID=A0A7X0EXP2_9ACTN|nr:hypothetical protein [Nonomuraea muscovyensis]MBB6344856.1 hypothetical protein [Nonomuraea muscovyensis]